MVQLKTLLAHQDNRQLRILSHMVKIQSNKNFKVDIVATCKDPVEVYKKLLSETPLLLIMEESLFTPAINALSDKMQVILITGDRSLVGSKNVQYICLPVGPDQVMKVIDKMVSAPDFNDSQDEIKRFFNSLNVPEKYCSSIDYFVESRHAIRKFGIDYAEQRRIVYSAIQSGELDLHSEEAQHGDTSFDVDGLYNPAVRSLLHDFGGDQQAGYIPQEEQRPRVRQPVNREPQEEPRIPVSEEPRNTQLLPEFPTPPGMAPRATQQPQDNAKSVGEGWDTPAAEPVPEVQEMPSEAAYAIPQVDNRYTRPTPVVEQPIQQEDIPAEPPQPATMQPEQPVYPVPDMEEELVTETPAEEPVVAEPVTEPEPEPEIVPEKQAAPNDVVSMEWETYPKKTTYALGEIPEISDGVVVAVFGDGHKELIPLTDDMIRNIRYTLEGEQMGIVELYGFTFQIPMRYTKLRLKKVVIVAPPKKMIYKEGERLDLTGLKMEKIFSDNSRAPLTNYRYDDVPLRCEMKAVPIKYGRRVCNLFVRVLPVGESKPDYDIFPSHPSVEPEPAVNKVSSKKDPPKKPKQEVSKPEPKKPAAPKVKPMDVELAAISAKLGKTEYFVGEDLDLTGSVLELLYNNEKIETIPMTANMVRGFFSGTAGTRELTISYLKETCTAQITVKDPVASEDIESAVEEPIIDDSVEQSQGWQRVIDSVSFANTNMKTSYANGERIKHSDFKLQVNYSDGTCDFVTDIQLDPPDVVTAGVTCITASYEGHSVSWPITVLDKQLVALMLDKQPDKLEYVLGDTQVDMTGAVATLFYTDQSFDSIPVPVEWVSGFDGSKAGKQTLTISHQGKTANFAINVMDRAVDSINVTKMPKKIKYRAGEIFDPSGMEVAARYNDGYYGERVPFSYPKEPLKAGEQSVVITVGNASVSVFIEVEESTVVKIAMESLPHKMVYLEGEKEFDPSGGLVAKFSSTGEKDIVPLSTVQYSGFNTVQAGIKRILVTVEQCTCEFEISVMKKTLESLTIQSMPLNTNYADGDIFDPTGLVLTAGYNDGTSMNVTNYIAPNQPLRVGTREVIVQFETMSVKVPVSVSGRQVESLSVFHMPDKTVYQQYQDTMDMTGAQLLVLYADGESAVVDITNDMVTGFNNSILGENVVTVHYMGATVDMSLQIAAANLIGIDLQKKPDRLEYNAGDFFDKTGMEVVAFYDNGQRQLLHHFSVSPNKPLTKDDSMVQIAYMDKLITLPIVVHESTGSYSGAAGMFYPDTSDLRFDDDDDI